MVRAYPAQPQEYGQEPQGGEWQALRGELVSLLDQVESQVARARRQDPGFDGIAERMRDIRFQVAEGEPQTRQRDALMQVKRAVDRFSDRDEASRSTSYGGASGYGAAPAGAGRQDGQQVNPRDMLQSAIRQIRARQSEIGGTLPSEPSAQRTTEPPRFDDLAHAVGGISGRLERLEVELKAQGRSQTGNVKEIAEQVGQLSHVVELLAGAVGETGQVRRLEGQIAGLAKLVSQGPAVDLSALTKRLDDLATGLGRMNEKHEGQIGSQRQETSAINQRLDDVTATMGRLADLQVQFANRVDGATQASTGLRDRIGSLDAGIKSGMDAVENGVRNIDAIEKNNIAQLEAQVRQLVGAHGPDRRAAHRPRQALQASRPSASVGGADLDRCEPGRDGGAAHHRRRWRFDRNVASVPAGIGDAEYRRDRAAPVAVMLAAQPNPGRRQCGARGHHPRGQRSAAPGSRARWRSAR
jgi:localization factor PodJL